MKQIVRDEASLQSSSIYSQYHALCSFLNSSVVWGILSLPWSILWVNTKKVTKLLCVSREIVTNIEIQLNRKMI